jgi:hypothetical protein
MLDIPEDAFEQRLERIEVNIGGTFVPVRRVSYRDLYQYEAGSAQAAVPTHWAVVGTEYRLAPTPSGAYSLRVWYLQDPPPLVLSQGRITNYSSGSVYVTVDSIGDDVSTELDSLDAFVNIVDGMTGKIKATLQVRSIDGNRVSFRTSPSQATVFGRTVASALPSSIEKGDFICSASGSCIPVLKKPFSNFLIQYAVAELQRSKLGGPADLEMRVVEKLEEQVERSWVGREQTIRVKRTSSQWAGPRASRKTLIGS